MPRTYQVLFHEKDDPVGTPAVLGGTTVMYKAFSKAEAEQAGICGGCQHVLSCSFKDGERNTYQRTAITDVMCARCVMCGVPVSPGSKDSLFVNFFSIASTPLHYAVTKHTLSAVCPCCNNGATNINIMERIGNCGSFNVPNLGAHNRLVTDPTTSEFVGLAMTPHPFSGALTNHTTLKQLLYRVKEIKNGTQQDS